VCLCAFSKSTGRAYSIIAGVSNFEQIRAEGHAFVDKSPYVALLTEKLRMYLLVRPRRQGKTMLLKMAQCLLERKEHLFRGLPVHNKIDWHDGGVPVITFDLSKASATEGENPMEGRKIFQEYLRKLVRDNAKRLEVEVTEGMPSSMFEDLLLAVSEKTDGKKNAAVLIDEYDAPVLQVLSKNGGQMDERVRETRDALHSFLLVTKSSADLTHCQVIMGATKFTLADSISQMNHLDDITHDKNFGGAMGFSWAEIETAFGPHVEALAGSRNETVPELRAEMWRRYGGYCYDGQQKVFNAWDVSCALQKQVVANYWLDHGFGSWLSKLLVPRVAPALFEEGVIISKSGDGNSLDKGLFEAMRNNWPIDEQQAWRALLQVGYLTVVEMKEFERQTSLVVKPPNDYVATAVRAGIFKILKPALRLALRDDDLAKVVNTAAKFVERSVYYHFYNSTGKVQERNVQMSYAIVWAALEYEFMSEVACLYGRADFVFEGTKNTHVLEFGMVSIGSIQNDSKLDPKIVTALERKTKQVHKYVCPQRNKKPIRFWVALFSTDRGELVHVSEV